MDIYSYLKKDHRKVSELMTQVLIARAPAQRERIFAEIKESLTLHAETEQETFYAALKKEKLTQEKIEDAEADHAEIKHYMTKLSVMPVESEKWLQVFGEFKHAVEHHVQDEESRIFAKAKKILSDKDAELLGEAMDHMKEQNLKHAA